MIKIKIKVYAIKTRSSMYIIFLLLKKAYTEILIFVLIFFFGSPLPCVYTRSRLVVSRELLDHLRSKNYPIQKIHFHLSKIHNQYYYQNYLKNSNHHEEFHCYHIITLKSVENHPLITSELAVKNV